MLKWVGIPKIWQGRKLCNGGVNGNTSVHDNGSVNENNSVNGIVNGNGRQSRVPLDTRRYVLTRQEGAAVVARLIFLVH